jgi:hypothetical protein
MRDDPDDHRKTIEEYRKRIESIRRAMEIAENPIEAVSGSGSYRKWKRQKHAYNNWRKE